MNEIRTQRSALASIALAALSSACTPPAETWTALTPTSVYASDSDTETKVLFTLSEGDVCVRESERMQKIYLHIELRCTAGRGWVVEKRNFAVAASA